MTYLSAMQEVAYLVGVAPPTKIDDSTAVAQRFRRMADRAGQEIARRADWTRLHATVTLTGDGAIVAWDLPADFDRLREGNPVHIGGDFLRGAVSADEWAALQALPSVGVLTARNFVMSGGKIRFDVAPASGVAVTVDYVSRNWIVGATTENFTTNEQTTKFPERLLVANVVWRWRRAQGAPFDDEVKEFEADLISAASFDQGLRPPMAA